VTAARSALLLAIIVAGATHTLLSESLQVSPSFFRDNAIDPWERMQLVIGPVISGVVVVLLSLLARLRAGPRVERSLVWLTKLLSPLVILPLAAPLFRRDFAGPAEAAIVLTAVVLLTERLVRYSLEALHTGPSGSAEASPAAPALPSVRTQRVVFGVVLAGFAAQAVYMSLFAVWSHQRFRTFGFDLGQYDQVFQSVLNGRPLRLPSLGWDYDWGGLTGHADLGSFYMLPIYMLYPRAPTLLVMQAVLIASAAIPVFLLARRHLPLWMAFVLAVAWLGYPPLHGAQLYDVHMQPFGMAWAMWALWAVDAKRFVAYWIFFAMAILCREDVSIGLTTLGLFLALSGYRKKTGIATTLVAFTFFMVLRGVIMNNKSGWSFADVFKELYPPGERGYGPVVKTMVSNPAFLVKSLISWEKLRFLLQLFAPLAFLPLRRPSMYVMLLPGALLTWFSTAYAPTISISFQYICNWTAYSFAIMVAVLALTADPIKRTAAVIALVVGITLGNTQWGAWVPNPVVKGGFQDVPFQPPTEADLQRHQDIQEMMTQLIPRAAVLCSADSTQPHTTWHLANWSLRDGTYECEYLIWTDLPGDLGNTRGMNAVAEGKYEVVETRRGVTVAKRRAAPPVAPQ
jgi:uncharacterized membrane protein